VYRAFPYQYRTIDDRFRRKGDGVLLNEDLSRPIPDRFVSKLVLDVSIAGVSGRKAVRDRDIHARVVPILVLDGCFHVVERWRSAAFLARLVGEGSKHVGEGSIRVGEGSIHVGEGSIHVGEGSIHVGEGSIRVGEGSIRVGEGSIHVGEGSTHVVEGSTHVVDRSIHAGDRSIGRNSEP
jgi:hypothetical protein